MIFREHQLPRLAELGNGHQGIPLQRLELVLNLILTTSTAAEKLHRLAKQRRKTHPTSLAVALDTIASEHGYHHWKHVKDCVEQTKSLPAASKPLPSILADFLASQERSVSVAPASRGALETGLVIALDTKHAQDVAWPDDFVECEEVRSIAAQQIWASLIHQTDEHGESMAQRLQGELLLDQALDHLSDLRLFRYLGDLTLLPDSLDEVFSLVLRKTFFPPTHVWLRGQFHDMAYPHDLQVDGRQVYVSNGTGTSALRKSAAGGREGASLEVSTPVQAGPDVNAIAAVAWPGSGFIPRLDVSKLEPGFYEFQVTYDGEELMMDGGFDSIRSALESAADVTGDIKGFEFAYRGFTIGTYPLAMLRQQADKIARDAVATVASLGDDSW